MSFEKPHLSAQKCLVILLLMVFQASFVVVAENLPEAQDAVYEAFLEPAPEMHPFVRWWWNGSRVNADDTIRQLEAMHAVGIGGVEINTIGLPEYLEGNESVEQHPALEWLGPEWTDVVLKTVQAAKAKGMTCDIIVGSGWPFGGQFLGLDEQSQRIRLAKFEVEGPLVYRKSLKDLWSDSFNTGVNRTKNRDLVEPNRLELAFVRCLPEMHGIHGFDPGKELANDQKDGWVEIEIPEGKHTLYVGFREIGYTVVKLGAPGADGPVVDHYNAEAVGHYLNTMSSRFEAESGMRMGELFRATFVDSLELDHANWTHDFPEVFKQRRGYSIWPYLPFVLDHDRPESVPFSNFQEAVQRARYDFVRTLIELFEERFVKTYVEWAAGHGMQARIQGYGRETHPIHGSIMAPLPEGETWLWRQKEGEQREIWPQSTVVNKMVSSGANISGKRLVSFEAMTNAVPVFRATLNDFKRAMDLSILDGLNHPILHGYNYFPSDADFPGWIRFGSYVSEHNPFWNEFPLFCNYVARVGTLLRNSDTLAQVAVLSPRAEEWAKHGMLYQPFPEVIDPWYQYEFPQAMQKIGLGVDHVSQRLLAEAKVENGEMVIGERSYPVLVLQDVNALLPKVAERILQFQKSGGKLVVLGDLPSRYPGLENHVAQDGAVKSAIRELETSKLLKLVAPLRDDQRPIPSPRGQFYADEALIDYAERILAFSGLELPVRVVNPEPSVSTLVKQLDDGRVICFIANRDLDQSFTIEMETGIQGVPVLWCPETGQRYPIPINNGVFEIPLNGVDSAVVVIEPNDPQHGMDHPSQLPGVFPDTTHALPFEGSWSLNCQLAGSGERFATTLETLSDLSVLENPRLSEFGGRIVYENTFNVDPDLHSEASGVWIDLGSINGSAVVSINGKNVGTYWYGKPIFEVSDALVAGSNTLTVEVSTVLANQLRAKNQNKPAAERRWAWWYPPIRMGLEGPVTLLTKAQP